MAVAISSLVIVEEEGMAGKAAWLMMQERWRGGRNADENVRSAVGMMSKIADR